MPTYDPDRASGDTAEGSAYFKPKEPAWHEAIPERPGPGGRVLPPIRLQLKFLTGMASQAMLSKVRTEVFQVRLGVASLNRYGYDDAEFSLLDDPSIEIGFGEHVAAVVFLETALIAWTGLSPPGEPEPDVTRENMVAAFQYGVDGNGPQLLAAVIAIANGDRSRIHREGEHSPPGPIGNGRAARNTAKAAPRKTRPARAEA